MNSLPCCSFRPPPVLLHIYILPTTPHLPPVLIDSWVQSQRTRCKEYTQQALWFSISLPSRPSIVSALCDAICAQVISPSGGRLGVTHRAAESLVSVLVLQDWKRLWGVLEGWMNSPLCAFCGYSLPDIARRSCTYVSPAGYIVAALLLSHPALYAGISNRDTLSVCCIVDPRKPRLDFNTLDVHLSASIWPLLTSRLLGSARAVQHAARELKLQLDGSWHTRLQTLASKYLSW